jgi:hypothetical protein
MHVRSPPGRDHDSDHEIIVSAGTRCVSGAASIGELAAEVSKLVPHGTSFGQLSRKTQRPGVQRWEQTGSFAAKPSGGSISPLEKHSESLRALVLSNRT